MCACAALLFFFCSCTVLLCSCSGGMVEEGLLTSMLPPSMTEVMHMLPGVRPKRLGTETMLFTRAVVMAGALRRTCSDNAQGWSVGPWHVTRSMMCVQHLALACVFCVWLLEVAGSLTRHRSATCGVRPWWLLAPNGKQCAAVRVFLQAHKRPFGVHGDSGMFVIPACCHVEGFHCVCTDLVTAAMSLPLAMEAVLRDTLLCLCWAGPAASLGACCRSAAAEVHRGLHTLKSIERWQQQQHT